MIHSIRWRLVLSYMLIALLAVSVVGFVTHRLVRVSLEQMERRSLQDNAEAVAQEAYALMTPPVETGELNQLVQTAAFLGDVHVQVLGETGDVLIDSDELDDERSLLLVMPSAIREMWERRGMSMRGPMVMEIDPDAYDLPAGWAETIPPGTSVTVIQRDLGLWGGRLRFGEVTAGENGATPAELIGSRILRSDTSVTVPIGDQADPLGYVEMSQPPALHGTLLPQLRQALLVAGGGAVLIAGLFGVWSSQRMAAPIKGLARTAARMGEGDLSVRADVAQRGRHGTEITELATQFNQMADNLQASFAQLAAERDALRRFIADASHELRTPITALKNFNALLLSGADEDPEIRVEFLKESQAQIERLAWITSHLLDLSRRDAGLVTPEIADHDIREVVRGAVAPFEPLAAERDVALVTQLPDKVVTVSCDRAQLEMALTNLLDNALKATSAGDTVTVSVADADAGVTITVADTGVGIQPADLPHVFQRFYRGNRPEAQYEGVGLGLAIVKSIVDAHGGTVAIESSPGEGTRVTISLPDKSAGG